MPTDLTLSLDGGDIVATWNDPTDGGPVQGYVAVWLVFVDGELVDRGGAPTGEHTIRISGVPAGSLVVVGVSAVNLDANGKDQPGPLADAQIVVPQ